MFMGLVFEDAYGGAGLKTILPTENKLKDQCVWKVGAAVLQLAQSEDGKPETAEIAKPNAPSQAHSTKRSSRLEQRLVRWLVRKTSDDRKFKKFELTPAKFFSDSKSAHVRLLGRLYLIRSTN